MSWNHRVFKDEHGYSIRETYYGKDGRPDGWTKDEIAPFSPTLDGLRQELVLMLMATYKDVMEDE